MKLTYATRESIVVGIGVLAIGLLSWGSRAAAEELIMPLRGDGFAAAQTYYRTSGHAGYNCDPDTPPAQRACALDISAVRWNGQTSQWVSTPPTPSSHPNPLANHLMWDAPVYAPFDGEIVSCWRAMTDDDIDGDEFRCPGGNEDPESGHGCARRGNHVLIRTADDRLVMFAHLQENSVPEALCPFDEAFLYTDDPVTCGFYDDARVDPPIPVTKGTFIGRVGTSGAGVGAHLHVGMSEAYENAGGVLCTGDGLPLEFVESWYQPRQAAPAVATDWIRLEGERLPVDGTDFLLWPDPVGPRTDTVALETGFAPAIAMTNAGGVVSFRTAVGNLASVAFGIEGNESFVLGTTEVEGPVDDVAVSSIGARSRHVVVAVENGSGRLQLIPYYVTQAENLIRGAGVTSGPASRVAITQAPTHTGVVTAIRNAGGSLTVSDFSTVRNGTDITVIPGGEAVSRDPIRRIAIDRIVAGRGRNESRGAFRGVVTAERRADNRLAIRTWSVSAGGGVALVDTLLATWASAPMFIDEVDVSVVGNAAREFVVTTSREASSDRLRVQSFEVSSTGLLSYVSGHGAGVVGPVASAKAGNGDVLVGVRSSTGTTIATSFAVRPNIGGSGGGVLRRTGNREAGAITDIDVSARGGSRDDAVLAVVDGNGEIRLIRYLTSYDFRN